MHVAALEPHHAPPGPSPLDEQRVDVALRPRGAAGALAHLDDLDALGQVDDGREPVAHDDVGGGQQAPRADGEQPGVARAAADDRDAAGARSRAAQRQLPGLHREPQGVAESHRAPRVAPGGHRHDHVVDARHRRHPGRRARSVVGPHAPHPPALAVVRHLRVHRAGRRDDQPGPVEVAGVVRPAVHLSGHAVRDLGRDDHDLRPGLGQGRRAPQGHRSPADHDHAPAAQVQVQGVGHPPRMSAPTGCGARAPRTRDTAPVQISAKTDYALRALCHLAVSGEGPVKADDIAAAQDVPRSFLDGILIDLRRAGLVVSRRGPVGGHRLARPAFSITVADVVRAMEGPLALVHGSRPEELAYAGPAARLQDVWVALRAAVRGVLESTTVEQVVEGRLPEGVQALNDDARSWVSVYPRRSDTGEPATPGSP